MPNQYLSQDDQLKMVFDYILVDVLDPLKQTTAFGLLSAVLSRKLVSPDLHDIMLKLGKWFFFIQRWWKTRSR